MQFCFVHDAAKTMYCELNCSHTIEPSFIFCVTVSAGHASYFWWHVTHRRVMLFYRHVTRHRGIFSKFSPRHLFYILHHVSKFSALKTCFNADTRSPSWRSSSPLSAQWSSSPLPTQGSSSTHPAGGQTHPSPPSCHLPPILPVLKLSLPPRDGRRETGNERRYTRDERQETRDERRETRDEIWETR